MMRYKSRMEKRILVVALLLGFVFCLGGCKEKAKELTFGDKELVLLTSTPRGGVESYQIYTTNIMIYADGRVEVYASDFVKWLGYEDVPVTTFYLSGDELQAVKDFIVTEDIYNLRENVGNKDGISGTERYITVYSDTDSHTTGGISVSNRQFVRAYDGIYEIVREDVFQYISRIEKTQQEGLIVFQQRRVVITDSVDNEIFDGNSINKASVESTSDGYYYVVLNLDDKGREKISNLTINCPDTVVVLNLYINDSFERKITLDEFVGNGVLYIECENVQTADALYKKIEENMN